jgi:hypothetical protein
MSLKAKSILKGNPSDIICIKNHVIFLLNYVIFNLIEDCENILFLQIALLIES